MLPASQISLRMHAGRRGSQPATEPQSSPASQIARWAADSTLAGRLWQAAADLGAMMMKPVAVAQAEARLTKARRALEALGAASTLEEMESHWETFLLAFGTFYSKLEQGSKGSGPSAGWFGLKRHERRIDPLLSYLHLARNVGEHSLAIITVPAGSTIKLHPGAFAKISSDGASLRVEEVLKGQVDTVQNRVSLIRVQDDRFGNWVDVPLEHLGKPINNNVMMLGAMRKAVAELRRCDPDAARATLEQALSTPAEALTQANVEISPLMLKAGEAALAEHRLGASLQDLASSVYFAMEYQRQEDARKVRASSSIDCR